LKNLIAITSIDELRCWVKHWSYKYPDDDKRVLRHTPKASVGLDVAQLEDIYRWKLNPRDADRMVRMLHQFDQENIGKCQSITLSALEAQSDIEALKVLRQLPGAKTETVVALASALLMVLNPSRWTVIDIRANKSLAAIKSALSVSAAELKGLANALSTYAPVNSKAYASDWSQYLLICRMISDLTGETLRTVDRALWTSQGVIEFDCGEDVAEPSPSNSGSGAGIPNYPSSAPTEPADAFLEMFGDVCNEVCITCFEAAAIALEKLIANSKKPSNSYGRDACALARAFRGGPVVSRDSQDEYVSQQTCICSCSYGPFPREISEFPDRIKNSNVARARASCGAVKNLGRSFFGAKLLQGKDQAAGSWRTGFEFALDIARSRCGGCGDCKGFTEDWDLDPYFLKKCQTFGFL